MTAAPPPPSFFPFTAEATAVADPAVDLANAAPAWRTVAPAGTLSRSRPVLAAAFAPSAPSADQALAVLAAHADYPFPDINLYAGRDCLATAPNLFLSRADGSVMLESVRVRRYADQPADMADATLPLLGADRPVFVCGTGASTGYFHWMAEVAARLAYFRPLIRDRGWDVLVADHGLSFVDETLDLLGLGDRVHRLRGAARLDRWLLADSFYRPGNAVLSPLVSQGMQTLLQPVLDRPRPAGGRRLFVSRSDARWRKVVNEAEIMPVLERFGFQRILPGKLSLAEQATLFRDAEVVLGPHGAGLTNVAFMGPDTLLIELFGENGFLVSHFWTIGSFGRVRYAPVLTEVAGVGSRTEDANMILPPARLEAILTELLGG